MKAEKGRAGGELSPWHKIAVLMLVLGEELAGEVMQYFGESEIEQITQAIADLKNVPAGLQDEVLLEFEDLLRRGDGAVGGGMDFARRLLEQALGAERAREILERMGQEERSGFKLLKNADPAQVAPFIAQEHPQAIALILSQLEPAQAAGILEQLPQEDLRSEVAHRIATLEQISPEVLREVEESLAEILRDVLGGKREAGGTQVVANILNLTGASMEKSVLDRLDAQDPEMAEEIRNHMLTFDDLARLGDRDMQQLLLNIDVQDLMIALKAAGKAVRDRFLTSMSERRRIRLLEDMGSLPPTRLSEVEEAQMRIVRQVRQMEEQGIIHIPKGPEEDPYV